MPDNRITRRRMIGALSALPSWAQTTVQGMREISPDRIVTIREEADWYMHSAGLTAVGDELVCTYRRTDEHVASISEIWCCRSSDGGDTWQDHRLISSSSFEQDRACWIAPQLGRTRDGRLLLLADRGVKLSKFDWPMLSQWQMKDRGMSNHLFISGDRGRTWAAPVKTDNLGGEPSYIIELSNGSLMYTRTDSRPTDAKKNPSMPWGPNYYRSTGVFSRDGGKTWGETHAIFDDPLVGDCEVGIAEVASNHIHAISRIGDAGSRFGQPSRFVESSDSGRSWSKPKLMPIYAHRPIVGKLRDGGMLVSYRNAWGTPGSCTFVYRPGETFEYQPNSFIWDEGVCRLEKNQLVLDTKDGTAGACEFTLYPVEDDDSEVDFQAEVMVKSAEANSCLIAAGAWIRLRPDRIELADRPQHGFAIQPNHWIKLRIVNHGPRIEIFLDGTRKLDVSTEGVHTRFVRFGNRSSARPNRREQQKDVKRPLAAQLYDQNAGVSLWRSIRVDVKNRRDHRISWSWSPSRGFPDQFRRDRVIRLERNGSFSAGNSGYSAWAQLRSGRVVVVDYTSSNPPKPHPILRAYLQDQG